VGHVYADARVFARRSVTTRFRVDTGATYTIVPPQLAREVGATVLPRRFRVALADGTERSLQACTMGVELCGRTAPMTALFSKAGEPLLGIETLEALGLRVNPERRTLEPTRGQAVLLVGIRLPAPRSSYAARPALRTFSSCQRAIVTTSEKRSPSFRTTDASKPECILQLWQRGSWRVSQ